MRYSTTLLILTLIVFSCSGSKYLKKVDGNLQVTLPASTWLITFPDQQFKVNEEIIGNQGISGYFFIGNPNNDLNISFKIEPAIQYLTSEECRDFSYENIKSDTRLEKKDFKKDKLNDYYTIQYLIPEFQGRKIDQYNYYANVVKDGYWINIHLSKINFKNDEIDIFTDFISNLKFEYKIPQYTNEELRNMNYSKEMTNEDFCKIYELTFMFAGVKFAFANPSINVEDLKDEWLQIHAYSSLKETCDMEGFNITDYQKLKLEIEDSGEDFGCNTLKWYPWSF